MSGEEETKTRRNPLDDEPETNLETGLSIQEVVRRSEKYGPNALVEKKDSTLLKFLKCFWGPMPIMIWIAIIIEAINHNWPDFFVLFALQLLNGLVAFVEEKKSADAIAALKNALAPSAEVKREGRWSKIDARGLVPGDVIQLKIGDVVPADGVLLAGDPVQVDQAALTGESLPVTVYPDGSVKMGSSVKRGESEAMVTHIGADTFLGRAASLVASVESQGRFQAIMFAITLGLLVFSMLLVVVIFFYLTFHAHVPVLNVLGVCVVLVVASIPIAMPVVCTSTMAVGSRLLAAKGAIVARLSAIEELAGMTILCSDKTGTLTKNELELNDPVLFGDLDADELVFWSALATKRSEGQDRDAIDTVIVNSVKDNDRLASFTQNEFVPFNPTDKRTEATVTTPEGVQRRVIKGAPQVILDMCADGEEMAQAMNDSMIALADRGYRPVAVAVTDDSGDFHLMGMLSLFDPPRDDTAETIARAQHHGVEVKMITGDHKLIAIETARQLNMGTNIHSVEVMEYSDERLAQLAVEADGFAEVFPEHKFKIVEVLRDQGYVTGMTGDGVNDAPALKRADIGVAVEGATEAARSAADIVLTEPGLMTIIDALIRSREIFQRMRNYCIYRVACSLQLLLVFFFSALFIRPQAYFGDTTEAHAFVLPVMALVLITVLNDGTIISIAYDNVKPNKLPQKWALGEVTIVASALGGMTCIGSMTYLMMGMTSAQGQNGVFSGLLGTHTAPDGTMYIEYGELLTAMYLQVSVSAFLTVFSARTVKHALSRAPGKLLSCAFVVACGTSSLLAHFWFFPSDPSSHDAMFPIGGKLILVTWIFCLLWWFLQDSLKLLVYRFLELRATTKSKDRSKSQVWVSRLVVGTAFLTLMSDYMMTTVIAPILPLYLKDKAAAMGVVFNITDVGLLFAAKPMLQLLLNPFASSWVDYIGPGVPLVFSLGVNLVTTLLYSFVDEYWPLVGARALQGVASSFIGPAVMGLLISSHTKRERGSVLNVSMSGIAFGTVLGPIVGGFLYQFNGGLGKALPFLVVSAFILLALLLVILQMCGGTLPWSGFPIVGRGASTPRGFGRASAPAALVPEDWAGNRRTHVSTNLRARNAGLGQLTYRVSTLSAGPLVRPSVGGDAAYTAVDAGADLENKADNSLSLDIPESSLLGNKATPISTGTYGTDPSSDIYGGSAGSGALSDPNSGWAAACNGRIMINLLSIMLVNAALGLVEPLVPLLLSDSYSVLPAEVGALLLFTTLTYLGAAPLARRIGIKVSKVMAVVLGMVLTALGLPIMSTNSSLAITVLGLCLVGFGAGLTDGPALSLVSDEVVARDLRAYRTVDILASNAVSLGFFLGPLLGGVFNNAISLSFAALVFTVAIGVAVIPVVFLTRGLVQERY